MNWEQKILREQASAGEVHALIPVEEFLQDGCFLTKSGHVGVALQLDPVPFETLDLEQADHIARRFEAALRVMNPAMRVYQYLVKRQISSTPHRRIGISLLERCTEDRLNYLQEQKGPLYSFDIYVAVVTTDSYRSRDTGPKAAAGFSMSHACHSTSKAHGVIKDGLSPWD